MKSSAKSYTSTTAVTNIDLSALGWESPSDVYEIADFDIEVVGNDAEVTMTGKGPFPASAHFAVTDGSFPIAGAKKQIKGFALAELRFTRVGTTSYTINIARSIE